MLVAVVSVMLAGVGAFHAAAPGFRRGPPMLSHAFERVPPFFMREAEAASGLGSLSIGELKALLSERGIDFRDVAHVVQMGLNMSDLFGATSGLGN